MTNIFTFREELWPRPKGGRGYYDHTITLPDHKWWDVVWTTWDLRKKVRTGFPNRWEYEEIPISESSSSENPAQKKLRSEVGTSTLWLRFKWETLSGSYFDLRASNLLEEIRSDLHSFLKDLAGEVKQLTRPEWNWDPQPICDIGLRLDYLIPPNVYIGEFAGQLFATIYLEKLLDSLPAYGLFTRIGSNTSALSSTQYHTWIQRLLESGWMASQFTLYIYAPLPSNLESLLQSLQQTTSSRVTDLFVDYSDIDSISEPIRDHLHEIAIKSQLTHYPLRDSLRIEVIWQVVIDNRDAILANGISFF